jgi:hypothetical protein
VGKFIDLRSKITLIKLTCRQFISAGTFRQTAPHTKEPDNGLVAGHKTRTKKIMNIINKLSSLRLALAVIGSLTASIGFGDAQSVMASISNQQVSSDTWLYTITLTDTGSTSIGSLWYAWTPDVSPFFYLPGTPTDISGTDGWSGSAVANSIQYVDGVDGPLSSGQSVNLSYEASFSPGQLAAAVNSGLSVAYEDGIESSPGTSDFSVVTAVPEPSSVALFAAGCFGAILVGSRKSQKAILIAKK